MRHGTSRIERSGYVQLGEEKAEGGDPIAVYSCLLRGCRGGGVRVFLEVLSDKASHRFEAQWEILTWEGGGWGGGITPKVIKHWPREEVETPSLKIFEMPTDPRLEQPNPTFNTTPTLSRGKMTSKNTRQSRVLQTLDIFITDGRFLVSNAKFPLPGKEL